MTARLIWLGAAHTEGDELTLVEPDATLVSGDVVQNETMPMIYTGQGRGGTPTSWLALLDKLAHIQVRHVIRDHSDPGDGSLVHAEMTLVRTLRSRSLELKAGGKSADQAAAMVNTEMQIAHPEWRSTDATAFVHSVFQEPDRPSP